MSKTYRLTIAGAILMVGVLLGAMAGFPAQALRWERFSDAYQDSVVVTRAELDADKGELRVRAESTSGTSVLTVYDLGGTPIGVLTRQDATRHEGRFDVAVNPRVISVRSSEGGEATVLVTGDDPPTVTPQITPTMTLTVAATALTATATPTDDTTPTVTATVSVTAVAPTATPTGNSLPPSPTSTQSIGPLPQRIFLPEMLVGSAIGRS